MRIARPAPLLNLCKDSALLFALTDHPISSWQFIKTLHNNCREKLIVSNMGRAGSFHIHSKSCYILPFWAVIYTRCDFIILFTAHFLGIAGPSYCVIFERVVSPIPLAPLCFVQGLEIG